MASKRKEINGGSFRRSEWEQRERRSEPGCLVEEEGGLVLPLLLGRCEYREEEQPRTELHDFHWWTVG